LATPKTTAATAKANPVAVTGNPAVADEVVAQQTPDGRPRPARVEAKVASTDDTAGVSTVEVTGLHSAPLRFSMPAGAQREHLDSLVEQVTVLWQREEDRENLIARYAVKQ
jgi:hypothetical protein